MGACAVGDLPVADDDEDDPACLGQQTAMDAVAALIAVGALAIVVGGLSVRVVIAADSLLLRAGIALEEAGFAVVGQASNGDDLLRKVRGHRPDVAVIDLPVEGLRAARAISSEVGLLLLAEHVDAHAAALMKSWPAGSASCSRLASPSWIASPTQFAEWPAATWRSTRLSSPRCSRDRAEILRSTCSARL